MIKSATLLALATGAAAQVRQRDALVSWWASPGCSGDPHTLVVLNKGYCNIVPNGIEFVGYRVDCAPSGAESGTISYCTDTRCSNCPITQPFTSSSQCVPNDPVRFGNAGVRVQCPPRGTGDVAVAELQELRPTTFEANWFEQEGCGSRPGGNFDRTIVVGPQAACHRVPGARDEGYRVLCNADGSGVFQVCSDRNCANCAVTTPFRSEQCVPNPPQYGSASVAFRCPGTPPPSLVPFRPARRLAMEEEPYREVPVVTLDVDTREL